LAHDRAREIDHHVAGEDAAAGFTRRTLAEPAFDDHGAAGKGEAGGGANQDPGDGGDDEDVEECGDADQGRHHTEDADMADGGDEAGRVETAGDVAGGERAADQADERGLKALEFGADRQRQAQERAGGEEQAGAEQQRTGAQGYLVRHEPAV
jgi:hypothetical protein